jgi:hypothetical protein
MSEEKKSPKLRAVALVWNRAKDGREFLSGDWGALRVVVFPNSNKQGSNPPDYYLYLTERQQSERQAADTPSAAQRG